jgi:hypothetical protein
MCCIYVTNQATAYSCSRTWTVQWTYGSCSVPQSHPSRFSYGRKLAYFSERRNTRNFKTLSPVAPTWRPSELVTFNTHVPLHMQTSIYRFLIIKPTRCTNFSRLFWNETLHVSDSSVSISRSYSLYTQQWYMSHRFVDNFRAAGSGWNCSSILILLLFISFSSVVGWYLIYL